jgi:signal transduction histidine kinase
VQATKRLRAALKEKDVINAELRRATQAKSDFLANMSHGTLRYIPCIPPLLAPTDQLCGFFVRLTELRTPMHGIIAMSRELQDLIEPSSNVNDAIDIISSTAPDTSRATVVV